MRRNRMIYTLLSLGVIGAFLGHGMSAVTGRDGVQAIGVLDLLVAGLLALMLAGNVMATGRLYTFAYSRFALVLYAWGALWGFMSAASRVTAVGELYPEVWDVVERAPSFLLPTAMVYLVFQHRQDHTRASTSIPVDTQTHVTH